MEAGAQIPTTHRQGWEGGRWCAQCSSLRRQPGIWLSQRLPSGVHFQNVCAPSTRHTGRISSTASEHGRTCISGAGSGVGTTGSGTAMGSGGAGAGGGFGLDLGLGLGLVSTACGSTAGVWTSSGSSTTSEGSQRGTGGAAAGCGGTGIRIWGVDDAVGPDGLPSKYTSVAKACSVVNGPLLLAKADLFLPENAKYAPPQTSNNATATATARRPALLCPSLREDDFLRRFLRRTSGTGVLSDQPQWLQNFSPGLGCCWHLGQMLGRAVATGTPVGGCAALDATDCSCACDVGCVV